MTFLENHDTGSTQMHWPFPDRGLHQVATSASMLLSTCLPETGQAEYDVLAMACPEQLI